MALTETDLLRLALLTYEAATEPALWPRFLELYNDAISSDMTLLQVHDLGLHKSNILCAFGISSPLSQVYNEHYSKLNVWRDGGRALYVAGAVNLDPEMCSRSLFERSEFYNEYLRRMDGTYCLGAVIARHQNQAPTLTALRGRQKGEFGEDERKVAKFLLPHLARAWTVYEKLELLAAGESVLDRLSLGIVFLVAGGVAVYSNRRAEEIFCTDDGLSMRNSRLSAWDRGADGQLRQAVSCALSPDRPVGPRAVGVPRASGRRAYQVVVAPIRARLRQFTGASAPRAVALLTDPERPEPAKSELLIELYGLTPKEAKMTIELSEAKSVEQAADEMGITYQTARTHLRRIFSKTETSRQSELLLLIARLPGGEGG
jgi:DNA-binding CsgD family transcriptional regulator